MDLNSQDSFIPPLCDRAREAQIHPGCLCLSVRVFESPLWPSGKEQVVVSSVLVFVVEDDEVIRQLLEDALTDGGFAVAVAANGDEAIAKLKAEGGNYHALVTDVNLPGKFSGWAVARHAREINETLPVLYVSGASGHDWASKGVPKSQIIAKPFAVAQVVTAISQLINDASAPL